MRSLRVSVIVWLGWTAAVLAAEPFARIKVEDDGRIVPGQQVRLAVDVFAPDFFTSPPQFPLFDLPDAIVTLPDDRAQNMVETVDGVQYSGIRRVYAVIPETTGSYTVPPIFITLGYSAEGSSVSGEVETPTVSFSVIEPTGGGSTFAARGLTITQSFDRDPSTLRVGDALVRTITVFAENTQAMVIPAVSAASVDGLKVYAKSPALADGIEGEDRKTGSTRTETVTYVVERVGTFDIPAMSYRWFDVEAHADAVADLPAITVKATVAPAVSPGLTPRMDQTAAPEDETGLSNYRVAAAAAVALLVAVSFILMFRPDRWLRAVVVKRREDRGNSEARKFKLLLGAARSDDPMTIYKTLGDWTGAAGFATISAWIATSDNEDITRETHRLEQELFSGDRDRPCFDRAAFARAVRAARSLVANSRTVSRRSSLPDLNPGQSTPVPAGRLLR